MRTLIQYTNCNSIHSTAVLLMRMTLAVSIKLTKKSNYKQAIVWTYEHCKLYYYTGARYYCTAVGAWESIFLLHQLLYDQVRTDATYTNYFQSIPWCLIYHNTQHHHFHIGVDSSETLWRPWRRNQARQRVRWGHYCVHSSMVIPDHYGVHSMIMTNRSYCTSRS